MVKRRSRGFVSKTRGGRFQVNVESPTSKSGFIKQGKPHMTRKKARKDLSMFTMRR